MTTKALSPTLDTEILLKAYELMQTANSMTDIYDEHRQICKYVHATSRGHEAIQLAVGMLLQTHDYVSPYYRDDSILLGVGFSAYDLMLQLLAKADDPFSGGRSYYAHPCSNDPNYPTMPNQSSATGMQALPAVGIAQGIQYLEHKSLIDKEKRSIVVCSIGDSSLTEGEVAEAFQVASFRQLPIIFLVQDNDWGISVHAEESRNCDAYHWAGGFKGLKRYSIDGSDFATAYQTVEQVFDYVRSERKPVMLHAKVPLLAHHTSGVRKEWYRGDSDLAAHAEDDPLPKLEALLLDSGISKNKLTRLKNKAKKKVAEDFDKAVDAAEPDIQTLENHIFAPTPITQEQGERKPKNGKSVIMVDAALHAMDEILRSHPEAIFYGQDVGGRLGGVFREAATLAQKYGDDRVFNTAIQEAYLVGSTAGMSIAGVKPIVEIQFADYFWPGMTQLACELAKSCYLSMGKMPIQSLIRVPIGAYGGGGPYHSGSIESCLLAIRGVKIVYPSNAADMKGLMKAAFYDPNPVIMLEHKGLYWSKVPGTGAAKTIEPDENYVIPLGKARIALQASEEELENGNTLTIITYGMGVHWALNAAKQFKGCIEILDLRTLNPLDEAAVYQSVRRHNKVMVLTEEPTRNSFVESLAGRISQHCFQELDAAVRVVGAVNVPAVPMNMGLEKAMLPNADKVAKVIKALLEE